MKKIICLMITGAALWGCGEAASNNAVKQPPSGPPVAKGVNLVPVSAPEDVNNAIRALLINQNDAYLESMKSYCNSGMMADASPASPTTAGSAPSFSSTNIQEAGVDEADILKTDGQYAYALSGKKLKITKVWPASDFKSIGELAITGLPNGMMLVDKTVIVFSNVTKPPSSLPATSKTTMCPVTGCGLGYSGTQVSIVDVKDPAHPSVVRETIYDGRLISQRRVGDKLYLVISSALQMANNIEDRKSVV